MLRHDRASFTTMAGRHSGFTFLELVVVMVIMAVAAAVALPRLGPQVEGSRLAAAEATLAGMAGMARYRAAQSGRPVAVVVSPLEGRLELVETGTSKILAVRGLGENVRVRFTRLAGHTGREEPLAIVFSPDGSAGAAEVCLETRGRETVTLAVEAATGRVRRERGGVGDGA